MRRPLYSKRNEFFIISMPFLRPLCLAIDFSVDGFAIPFVEQDARDLRITTLLLNELLCLLCRFHKHKHHADSRLPPKI